MFGIHPRNTLATSQNTLELSFAQANMTQIELYLMWQQESFYQFNWLTIYYLNLHTVL